MMTEDEVSNRLETVRKTRWKRAFFKEWYGVDLLDKGSLLFKQFETWVQRLTKKNEIIGEEDVEHWAFELFCQQREWVPLAEAAARFAMSPQDFKLFLDAMGNKNLIAPSQIDGDVSGVYSESFLRNLPKLLPSFPRRTFTSQSSYTYEFHTTITTDLPDLHIHLLHCSVSEWLKEVPVEAASDRDIITREPIGLGHQIWLEFKKPLALKPDACSIRTYAQHKSLLSTFSMGGPGFSELSEVEAKLHEART